MTIRRGLVALAIVCCMRSPVTAVEPYDIDVVLPLTGPLAFLGSEQRESLEILQSDVNRGGGVRGRAIRFVIVDSQSNPQTAVQLTGQIVARHPAVMIGDSAVATCAAMAPLVATGPLEFCLSPGFQPKPGGNTYSIGASPQLQAAAIVRFARARGWTRLALLNQNDATGDSVQAATNAELAKPENQTMRLVATERFSAGDISLAAQLSRIRAADAQYLVSYNSGAPFGIVLRSLHDAGLDLPVFTSQGNLSYTELKALKDDLPSRLFFVAGPLPPDGPELENNALKATDLAYLQAFRAQGVRPDFGHAAAWDSGSVVVASLRARGLQAGPGELRAYINSLHGFPTIQGLADFRSGDGRGVSDTRILAWNAARNTWSIESGPGGMPKTTIGGR